MLTARETTTRIAKHFQVRLGGTRVGALMCALVACCALLLTAGCTQATAKVSAPSVGSPTFSPAPTPTLPTVTAQPGWTITAPLGYVSPGVVTSGTSFVVEHPYQVVVICEGQGSLAISVSSPSDNTTQIYSCGPQPRTVSVQDAHPPIGQTVHVSVAAEPDVIWVGAVESQQ